VALERELEVFARELPGLMADTANHGRYVLIGGDPPMVAGVYATVDAAIVCGYEKFGLATFLAKQIQEHEKPLYLSRNVICRSSCSAPLTGPRR
jgi:hypothetical protein